jgi:hypothetical protein
MARNFVKKTIETKAARHPHEFRNYQGDARIHDEYACHCCREKYVAATNKRLSGRKQWQADRQQRKKACHQAVFRACVTGKNIQRKQQQQERTRLGK